MYALDNNSMNKFIPTALGHMVNYLASSGFYVHVDMGKLLLGGITIVLTIQRDCEDTRISHTWEILLEDLINTRISQDYWKNEVRQKMMQLLLICYEGKWEYED